MRKIRTFSIIGLIVSSMVIGVIISLVYTIKHATYLALFVGTYIFFAAVITAIFSIGGIVYSLFKLTKQKKSNL